MALQHQLGPLGNSNFAAPAAADWWGYTCPIAVDWSGDGRPDLIVAESRGWVAGTR